MSRSAGRAVYAVSLGRDVGVDVEQIRDLPGLTEVARRLFAASERELLAGSPESSRTRVFFRLWSRKEALAKAIGSGLFNQLNVIDLSALSSGSNILVKWPGDPGRDREWAVCDLGEDEGFAMALAAEWPCVLPPRLRPFAMDSGQ
jgi:4'-phosphopantetheinyl transferase